MPDRETRSIRIDPEIWSQFVNWVMEKEGQKYGELGRHVEYALNEYMDRDRNARIEERLEELTESLSDQDSTHTHTDSRTMERTKQIVRRIVQNHTLPVKVVDLERAIEDIAGGDERTVEKYKSVIKRRGLLFEHPHQPVWTDDKDEFGEWLESNGADQIEIAEEYGMDMDEVEEIMGAELLI